MQPSEELIAPPPSRPPRRLPAWAAALGLGLSAALLFVLLAAVRIDAQGPQYDELHQATGSFTWLGSPPELFCLAAFDRVCVLNTTYSGAIKTHLFGAWMRLSGGRFTLAGWRLFGISLLAVGIFLFPVLARRGLPFWSLAVFLALLLTDATVLVLGRFDWGPVSLSLALRLALLGLWLGSEAAPKPSPWSSFGLGALAGFATFEKLSACLLVLPVAAMILGSRRRRTRRHALAAVAGLALGAAPLALVNVGSLATLGEPISLRNLEAPVERSLPGFAGYAGKLLRLGQGGGAAGLVLGTGPWPRQAAWEGILLAALLCGTAVAAALAWRSGGLLRRAGIALASYLAVGIGLYFLPRPTSYHHWILATPFQYAAVALALSGLAKEATRARKALAAALVVLVTVWIGVRIPNLIAVERAFARGSAAPAWSTSLTRLGTFAARQADHAIFVASDWGVATQIYSLSQGRPGLVHEPFWEYPTPGWRRALAERQARERKPLLYLVRLDPPARVRPGVTESIERDLVTDPRWMEVPAEPEVARLPGIKVRKLLAVGPPGRPGPAIEVGPGERISFP